MAQPTDRPVGLAWRSHTVFILTTIGIVCFSDLFLFAVVVPILPFLLEERANVSPSHVQSYVSAMLTVFSASQVAFSPVVAWAADRVRSRKALFLFGLFLLAAATALLFTARTVPLLIASRIMQGASASIVWIMGMAMCCETVGPEDLGKAISSVSVANRHCVLCLQLQALTILHSPRYSVSSRWGLCLHQQSEGQYIILQGLGGSRSSL